MPALKKPAPNANRTSLQALMPVVAVAAWAVPGLGHLIIGQRTRGLIFLVVITMTFWGGVAIGGVRSTVDPQQRRAWFLAQVCSGTNALAALSWAGRYHLKEKEYSPHRAVWPADDIAVVYTGVAGLLNLLVIFDVLGRLDSRAASSDSKTLRRQGGDPS